MRGTKAERSESVSTCSTVDLDGLWLGFSKKLIDLVLTRQSFSFEFLTVKMTILLQLLNPSEEYSTPLFAKTVRSDILCYIYPSATWYTGKSVDFIFALSCFQRFRLTLGHLSKFCSNTT